MSLVEKGKQFRREFEASKSAAQKFIMIADISDEEIEKIINLYDKWEDWEGKFIPKDKILQYEGLLYKVTKGVNWQLDWTPSAAVSEFERYYIKEDSGGTEVVAPFESGRLYMKGEKCEDGGFVWESQIDNNSWAPTSPGMDERYWIKVTS